MTEPATDIINSDHVLEVADDLQKLCDECAQQSRFTVPIYTLFHDGKCLSSTDDYSVSVLCMKKHARDTFANAPELKDTIKSGEDIQLVNVINFDVEDNADAANADATESIESKLQANGFYMIWKSPYVAELLAVFKGKYRGYFGWSDCQKQLRLGTLATHRTDASLFNGHYVKFSEYDTDGQHEESSSGEYEYDSDSDTSSSGTGQSDEDEESSSGEFEHGKVRNIQTLKDGGVCFEYVTSSFSNSGSDTSSSSGRSSSGRSSSGTGSSCAE